MSDKKLIVFDFDGTLVESQSHFDEALTEFSNLKSLPYDLKKMSVGYVDPFKNDLGWGIPLAEQPAVFTEFTDYLFKETSENKRFIPDIFDDITEMLDQLQPQFDFGIVTARARDSLLIILEHRQLQKYFKGYRTLCCVREKQYSLKPAPDALLCLLKEMDYQPQDVVMIGDTTSDILMANNAGVKSIAVLWGAHSREKLETANPTLFVENVKDLPQAIEIMFSL
jgi:phosphoglycolate phosphatase